MFPHIARKQTGICTALLSQVGSTVRNSDVGVGKDTKSQHSMSRDRSYKVTHYKKQYEGNDSEDWTTVPRYRRNYRRRQQDQADSCQFCGEPVSDK